MARYLTRQESGHRHALYLPDDLAEAPVPQHTHEHVHDGLYAPGGHEHLHDHDTDYAPTAHGHDTSHDHSGLYAPAHAHPYATDDHVHPGGDATHPDLASHVSLGLTADTHSHPHDHDGDYATPHLHPYAADGHTHQEAAHDHDADYAADVHSHDTTHDHDGTYSAQAHGHTSTDVGAAPAVHTHDTTHDHSGVYSDAGHAHTAAEVGASATGHTHDTTHNHDASYSSAGHNHDAAYSPSGHAHVHDHTGTYSPTDHTHQASGEVYAVGDLFLTTRSGNPSTLLGYGTWSAFGEGRLLLSGAQGTAGNTAGSATHSHGFTQPSAHTEVISHTHTTDSQGAHVHDEFRNGATTGGLDGWGAGDTSTNNPTLTGYDTGSAGGHTHTASAPAGAVASIAHSGGAVADGSTAPPNIACYVWLRTA